MLIMLCYWYGSYSMWITCYPQRVIISDCCLPYNKERGCRRESYCVFCFSYSPFHCTHFLTQRKSHKQSVAAIGYTSTCYTIIHDTFHWNKITEYNWHNNKNTDGPVNRLASNLVIFNQAHRVAWLIGEERIIKNEN